MKLQRLSAVQGTLMQWFNPLPLLRFGGEIPDGAWNDEPSKMQWVDAATGLPCLIVRNGLGFLCGDAGVDASHSWYKRGYDGVEVDVHGGLTFANACAHSSDESQGVCHIPEPGTSNDVWWFGFDCAHCFDLVPGMMHGSRDVYRDVDYVAAEVTSLAAQLRAAAARPA